MSTTPIAWIKSLLSFKAISYSIDLITFWLSCSVIPLLHCQVSIKLALRISFQAVCPSLHTLVTNSIVSFLCFMVRLKRPDPFLASLHLLCYNLNSLLCILLSMPAINASVYVGLVSTLCTNHWLILDWGLRTSAQGPDVAWDKPLSGPWQTTIHRL